MGLGSGQFTNQRANRPHLLRGRGTGGEVADLRDDVKSDLAANAAIAVEEFIDLAATDVDAFKASFASSAAAEDFSGADLDGVVGTGTIDPPRSVVIASSTNADIDAVVVVVTGKDVNGDDLTEDILLTDGGGTDEGVKAFASISRVEIPAQAGTNATMTIGFTNEIGFAKPIRSVAGVSSLIKEIAAGAVVTTGVVTDAATSPPNGTYLSSAAPDDSNDYAVYYDYDASQN